MKLHAGALNFAIVLGLIASTMALLLLVWQDKQSQLEIAETHRIQLRQNCLSAWALEQATPTQEEYTIRTFDLYGEGRDSIRLISRNWGAFRLVSIEAKRMSYIHRKALLYGRAARDNSPEQPALWLGNSNKALYLAGKTTIEGNVYVSKKGIKTAYIEGKGFEGKELVKEQIYSTDKPIAALPLEMIEYAQKMGSFQFSVQDSLTSEVPQSTKHPWHKRTLIYQSNKSQISEDSLSGNIILYRADSIVISPKSHLQDVLICAPFVRIKSGVKGRFHIIASDTIIIERDVELAYPSSVFLVSPLKLSSAMPLLTIGKNTTIEGIIIVHDSHLRRSTNAHAVLESGSSIVGQVYVQGNLEPKGLVLGHIVATKIVLHTQAAIYENHILDASISASRLPKPYAGIVAIQDQETHTKIYPAIWLNCPQTQ